MAESPVLIVGGGLGGLTLSLCLAKVGIPSVIFERRSELTESGAGIQLSPNCLRVYDYLGCLLYTSPSPRDLSTSRMPSSA